MKLLWQSKTFWVQVITAVLGAIEAMGGTDVIPTEYQGAVLLFIAALNTIMRLLTTKPVTVQPSMVAK